MPEHNASADITVLRNMRRGSQKRDPEANRMWGDRGFVMANTRISTRAPDARPRTFVRHRRRLIIYHMSEIPGYGEALGRSASACVRLHPLRAGALDVSATGGCEDGTWATYPSF